MRLVQSLVRFVIYLVSVIGGWLRRISFKPVKRVEPKRVVPEPVKGKPVNSEPVRPGPEAGPAGQTLLQEYTLDTDLRTFDSGITAAELDAFLAGAPMEGLGSDFLAAEKRYGVNAVALTAIAIHESGWGRSKIAQEKHNLFGFQAYDSSPFESAASFTSFAEGIDFVASYIARNYLNPEGRYYGGAPSLSGMNIHWASDPHWAEGVLRLMNEIIAFANRGRSSGQWRGSSPYQATPLLLGK